MEEEKDQSMLPTYPAVLTENRLEWIGEVPTGLPDRARVDVTVLEPPTLPPVQRGQRMAAALESIAARGGLASIPDPLAWERQLREDSELPGRE